MSTSPDAQCPRPDEIKAWRGRHKYSMRQCARLLHTTERSYRQWESGDRRMHPGLWAYARSITNE
jgi:DNA-binding transcriptional regulator YiaG